MFTSPKDLFDCDSDFHSTPDVARAAGISESSARAHASEIGVRRVGSSYAWSKANYEELLALLYDDEEEEDEEDDEDVDEDDDDDEDEVDEDDEDEDEDEEEEDDE